jgi:arabinose-5-phosphate isomerase
MHEFNISVTSPLINTAIEVVVTEQQAINKLAEALTHNLDQFCTKFSQACEILIKTTNNQGRIIVTGIGKSGHIGNKIAASFSSLGSPAFFIHAAEAGHGDFGMITKNDAVIALSYSGASNEIIDLLPSIKNLNVPLISITGNNQSILAQNSTIHLPIFIDKEACHLNLAPTASTTATLVLGDALTIAVTKAKAFTCQDFARSHPSGNLGRRLLLKVSDIMVHDNHNYKLPVVSPQTTISNTLLAMTNNNQSLGMVAVVDHDQTILGIFTDGDLRRIFSKYQLKDTETLSIAQVMNTNFKTIDQNELAIHAWEVMQKNKINGLLVVDKSKNNILVGMLNTHTLTAAKII